MKVKTVIVCMVMGLALAGCDGTQKDGGRKPDNQARANDPDARSFKGTVIGFQPTTSTLKITRPVDYGRDRIPIEVKVKYDAQTKFYLDGKPTTLDELIQYMPVEVDGHMRDGQMFAEAVRLSSELPPNVRRPEPEGPAAQK
jgi:hypothetical protein